MKLDQIILGIVIAGAAMYLLSFVVTAFALWPWGLLLLVPIGIVLGILGVVIYQKVTNKEDDYYENNVEK